LINGNRSQQNGVVVKLRDSGMPEEGYWESLFDVPLILNALGITSDLGDVAEMGCGFGTFSVPVAQRIRGTLFTFDIDPAMVVCDSPGVSDTGRLGVYAAAAGA
jgi:hypothetical protein